MKALIILIIAAAVTFQWNNLYAYNGNPTVNSKGSISNQLSLAPKTPAEATFEDPVMVCDNDNIARLAPITPREATFTDIVPELRINLKSLAPVAPMVATFDDDNVFTVSMKIADMSQIQIPIPDTL